MFIPKRYGQSKVDKCPFCDKSATAMNAQKVPVCGSHRQESLDGLRCACGSSLEMLYGKFGVFFSCMKCGNMNLRKVLEINIIKPRNAINERTINAKSKEITVRSDDSRYFD